MKIEVTYNCPLSCIHCSSDANPDHQLSISIEKCLEIVEDALSIGITEIAFSGGEPLTWKGIIDVVTYSKKNGLNVSIYTSGNCENQYETLKNLATAGVNRLVFSLYSDVEKEHDRVTRKANSFSNTMKAIEYAHKLGIETEIHFVALASNYKKIAAIAELAQTNGISRISVLRFVPQGRGTLISDYDTLSKEQNLELKDIIIDLRRKGFNIRTGSPFNVLFLNDKPKCMAAKDRLIVAPDLNIYPCDAFKQIRCDTIASGDKFSNLTENRLAECWENSKYFDLVRAAIASTPSEPCQSCKSYKLCLSGCLAQKYLYHSSLYKNPDPACLKLEVKHNG